MNEPLPEELLSAYLDGELPGEERARVEQWLLDDPANRRLYDDLLALRREVQALPKQTLDSGFSERVLSAIRSRSEPEVAVKAETPDVMTVNKPGPNLGMPAWRWFAAGVAATLAVVVLGINVAPTTLTEIGLLPRVESASPAATGFAEPKPSPPAAATSESTQMVAPRENVEPQAAPASATAGDSPGESASLDSADTSPARDALGSSKDLRTFGADRMDARGGSPGPELGSLKSAFRAPGAAARFNNVQEQAEEADASKADSIKAKSLVESQKPISEWLDEALTRDDEAVLQLNLALRSHEVEAVDDLDNGRTAPAPAAPDAQADGAELPKAESNTTSAPGPKELADDMQTEGVVEIVGTRDEVERMLAALTDTNHAEGYFLATPALQARGAGTSSARKAGFADKAGDRQLESAGASRPRPEELESSATPALAPASIQDDDSAALAEKKKVPEGSSGLGSAGGMKQRMTKRTLAQGLSGKDVRQQLRVRVHLVPAKDGATPEAQPTSPGPEQE